MVGTMAIDYRPISDLIAHGRKHTGAQVALIAGTIREFGFTSRLLVDDQIGIIAGQGRVMMARKVGPGHRTRMGPCASGGL
jgi:ParB-like chromosome segregation protein Spo0J